MRAILPLLLGLGLLPTLASEHTHAVEPLAPERGESGWKPLFNGRDLSGWYTFVDGKRNHDPQAIVQVRDGVVHMYRDTPAGAPVPYAYIATEAEYEEYDFRFEYRWGVKKFGERVNAKRDAGLIYHFVGEDKIWPRGIECQVQEEDTGDIYVVLAQVSSTVAPGTRIYKAPGDGGVPVTIGGAKQIARIQKSRTLEKPEWNKVEVRVRRGAGTHLVNGEENAAWTDLRQPESASSERFVPLNRGRLLLQAEGAEIMYRNIEIREIRGDGRPAR